MTGPLRRDVLQRITAVALANASTSPGRGITWERGRTFRPRSGVWSVLRCFRRNPVFPCAIVSAAGR